MKTNVLTSENLHTKCADLYLDMNYLVQINSFWEKFSYLPDGKPYHIVLYFGLLKINNSCGWLKSFKVDFTTMLQITRLDKNTYYKSCNFLFQHGFLSIWEKGRNQLECARFGLAVLYDKSESEQNANITQGDCPNNASGIRTENERKNPKLYKHNKLYKQVNVCIRPEISEIEFYFLEKKSTKLEAELFFNFNDSRAWTKIADWKPLANNWIIKSNETLKQKQNDHNRIDKQKQDRYFVGEQDYQSGF